MKESTGKHFCLEGIHLVPSVLVKRLFSACTRLEGLVEGTCSSMIQISRLAMCWCMPVNAAPAC